MKKKFKLLALLPLFCGLLFITSCGKNPFVGTWGFEDCPNSVVIFGKDISNEFRQDTARIEQKVRDLLYAEYSSTVGYILANELFEEEYDVLVDKYYKLLYAKLNKDGKKALKDAQLHWRKFRDAEINLITELKNNTFEEMGGGIYWEVFYGDWIAKLTRERVFVLYKYLIADGFEDE